MMNRYQKVKDHQDYSKDCLGGAIINTNTDEFQKHLERKREKARILELETKVSNMESLLERIASKLNV